jgi:hypothetical protein
MAKRTPSKRPTSLPSPLVLNPSSSVTMIKNLTQVFYILSTASYDTLTPQMKPFSKDNAASARKKRTNTIEPVVKIRETKKSKGKKSRSQEKLRKTVSLDKCNDKDLSD